MVILLTGASSGIGAATAQVLSEQGYKVYGTYRKNPPQNPCFIPVYLDVQDEDSVRAAVEQVLSEEGRLDALINNAGMGIAGPVELTTEAEAAAQMNINFLGALTVTRHALPALRQSRGRVLCVSSLAAQIPLPFQALYSASKAALEIAMQAIEMECLPFGVRCTCVELGDTKTEFTKNRRYAKATEGDEVYAKRFKRSVARMEKDEQNGYDPKMAANFIAKQLKKRNPPPIAVCGAFPKAVYALRKLLPIRWANAIIGNLYAK
ncbi:MAG: SDR family oxidoreductase [Christensenellales bacterium]